VIPLTRVIPKRIRGGYDDALYKSTFTLLYFRVVFDGGDGGTCPGQWTLGSPHWN